MQNNQPRRKGFSFLSFLLGMLFGIIVFVGTLAGIVYYALSAKIDDVLNTVGVDNGKDENGNNKLINTDVDNGGVSTLLELVSKVGAMASDMGNMSVAEVENLLPAMSGLVDGIYEAVSAYVELDRSELVGVKFADFGGFVQEKVMSIQPAALLDSFGMGGALDTPIFEAVFYGAEAKYAVNGDNKYPVYYDTYVLSESGSYLRKGDDTLIYDAYIPNLVQKDGEYILNYYIEDGVSYVTDGDYTYTSHSARSANGLQYALYNEEYSTLTGNFYELNGVRTVINPITLGTFANGFDALNGIYLSSLLGGESGSNDLALKVLGTISLGDVMNGNLDFETVLANLHMSDILDTKANDKVMVSLIYKISSVAQDSGEDYDFTGSYKVGDPAVTYKCYIKADENGNVGNAYYLDGETKVEIQSITVKDLTGGLNVEDLLADFTVDSVMQVKPDEAIMAYIAFGLYNIDKQTLEASYDIDEKTTVVCVFDLDGDGYITNVRYKDSGELVPGTPISEINGRIGNLTYKLKIKDLIDSDDALFKTLGDSTVYELPSKIKELTVKDVLGEDGVKGNKLLENLADVPLNSLAAEIDSLKLNQIMTIDNSSSKLLQKLGDYTINELPTAINGLVVKDVMEGAENNFLLKSLANTKITELPAQIGKLTINTLYAEKIYAVTQEVKDEDGNVVKDDKGNVVTESKFYGMFMAVSADEDKENAEQPTIIFNPDYIYYEKNENGEYVLVGGTGKLTSANFVDGKYYTYGEAQGMWKMLLYGKVSETSDETTEYAYTLEKLTDMIGNVSHNLGGATLRELHENGIMTFDNENDLNAKTSRKDEEGNVLTLGELTIPQAVSVAAEVLEKLAQYGN